MKTTLADIRAWIISADAKLEVAYDAAEKGAPVDVLLDHICHSVMLEPVRLIHQEDLTQTDAKRLYSALFPVLACIQGAIKLADGTLLQHTLEGAFELLDSAQTALDPVNEAVRTLAEGGAERDFLRGRDIAIKMIDEGSALRGERDCYRRHRDPGATQDNFVNGYLADIIDEPALRLGFTAVLSQIIGSGEGFDGKYFAQLTLAETQAGQYGADATQPLADDAPSSATMNAGLMMNQATEAKAPTPNEWGDFDPYRLMQQAKDVAEVAALNDEGTDAMWGVHSLIEKALEKVSQAVEHREADSQDLFNKASDELACTLAVLSAVNNDGLDNALLYAADTQIRLAKQQIDAKILQLVRGAA
ncbi:hypothetical protein ABIC89_002798 [Variovorax boronicumulans]|uniref:hypothetical protein n=1 Tax=Variovorax boronicumulans TaxID=436515 RepID=UPI0033945A3B